MSNMSQPASSPAPGTSEQRKQIRFAVSQPARLRLESGEEIMCDIADFCLGGLFLKFDIPERDGERVRGMEGNRVNVMFTLPQALGGQTHEVRAKLVRRSATGAGLAFDETPVEATRALNKVAASMRSQKAAIKLYGGVDLGELKSTCKAFLKQAIDDAFSKFGEQAAMTFEKGSLSAKSIAEHQAFLDAPRLVQRTLEDARYRCLSHVLGEIESLGASKPKDLELSGVGGLSIVEKDDFEDWLSIAAESNRLEEQFSEMLMNLEPRLEKLYGVALDAKNNPYAPAIIGQGVHHAFEEIAFIPAVRQVLYAAMRDSLALALPPLYRSLLEVLPEADRKAEAQATAPSPFRGDDALGDLSSANDMAGLDAPLMASNATPGDAAAQSGGGNMAMSLGRMASSLMSRFRRTQATGQAAMSASTQNDMPSSAAMPNAAQGASGVPAGQIGSTADMANASMGGELSTGGFHPALSPSSVRAFGDLVASGRIPKARQEEARVSADVFGALIEAMNTERAVPGAVKSQIQKLEDSLLKVAVLDPAFLNNTGHAAHRTLNAMDRLSMVSSDDGKVNDEKILAHINRWVERIHNEADKNPNVFEEARQQLEKILLPLMKKRAIRIAKLQAALEGWQKTGQANRRVLKNLDQRIVGKQVPAVVLDLFAPGWRNYLIRVLLRQGEGCEEEVRAWRVIDDLLEWLRPGHEEKPDYQRIQQHLQYVDACLRLVSSDKDEQDRLVDRLTETLLKPGEVEYKTLASPLLANAEPAAAHDGENDPLDSFRVGDWVDFSKAPVPLNLVWIGDDPELYVFCNFKGVKKLELKREEFISLLESGEAKHTDNLDLPLMDRSFSSMIQLMHNNLLKQATVDETTGLMGRREFMRLARRAILGNGADGHGNKHACHAMAVLDFEEMRLIAARTSPEAQQAMLRALAEHLKASLGGVELLTHSANRAFALLMPMESRERLDEMAEQILAKANQFQFLWEGQRYGLNANLGVACANVFSDPEELYTRADEACLEARHLGRNRLQVYRDEEGERKAHSGLVYWADKLGDVLHDGRLYLRCQPIVAVENAMGAVSHYEVLLGADMNTSDPVNIGEMVAALERLGRVGDLDRWVVNAVFQWMRDHPQDMQRINALSINLSGQSVNSKGFLNFLTMQLGAGDIPGHKLIFEITESAAIDNFAHAEQFIRQVRRYGCKFALDDFGIGFSSFSYLKNLKVDYLKVDGSFVKDITRSEVDVALVSSMHETSRFLGIKTVAEAVENQETLDILKNIGVDYAQGYFTGRPMPIERLAA